MPDKPEYQNYPNDEINLMDYIKVIIKRKKLIIGIFIICVVATTIVSFRMPKVYQIDSTARIGSIGGSLFSVGEMIEKTKNRNLLQSVIQEIDTNITVESLKEAVKIEKVEGTNFLKVQMESAEPGIAIDILNKIESKLVLDGNEFYEKNITLINERIQELHARKENVSKQIKMLNQKISNNKIGPDYPLIQNTLTNYETIYSELSAAEYSLKKNLLLANNFKIIESPSKSMNPIKPNKRQMITISAILGLILGLFIAFIVEFWQKSKEDRQ